MALNQMIAVSSSSVAEIGYGQKKKALVVRFKNGGVYIYQSVPQQIFTNMLNASSKGSFLDSDVKNVYSFLKITEAEIDAWLDAKSPKVGDRREPRFTGFSRSIAFI